MSDLQELQDRIAWARKKIESLAADINRFKVASYSLQTTLDPQGNKHLFVVNSAEIPTEFRIESGSITHELRATLDSLASVLARRHNANCSTEDVYFPISHDLPGFIKDGKRKIRKLSPTDQARIEALNPYNGGNNLLYAMHKLDITGKHSWSEPRQTGHAAG